MSLQRRLLLYLLICAPLVWGMALLVSAQRARHEVNELFDTEIIRLAVLLQSTLVATASPGQTLPRPAAAGEADLRDLANAVWNRQGQLLLVDREGVQLPRREDASGFVDMQLGGEPWRVYYLHSPNGDWLVAAGQRGHECDELVWDLVGSQLMPWLLVLPVLLLAMAWAVQRALQPMRRTSCARHWPCCAHSGTCCAARRAHTEQTLSDGLPLAERRRIELDCEWPAAGAAPMPMQGDPDLMTVLLRNLLDNAVRYAPEGSTVRLCFGSDRSTIENDSAALPAQVLAHLGQRLRRVDGQAESSSGLGVSIVQRIAALHGLSLRYRARADGQSVVAELGPVAEASRQ